VSIQLHRMGRWFHQADGRSACLLKIKSGKATHVNLILSGMPDDQKSSLFAYGPDGNHLHEIQSLTDQQGASIPVSGEELILEYNGPTGIVPEIKIDWI